MQAALIGGRAFFGRDIKTDFQRTGTYHILVVSGINVGILAFAVFWVLRSLPFGETWATILTDSAFLGICLRRRSGLAHRASHHHAQHLSADAVALSRPRRTERLGIAAFGILLVNPTNLVRSQLSADVSFRDRGRRHRRADLAAHDLSAAERAAESRLARI